MSRPPAIGRVQAVFAAQRGRERYGIVVGLLLIAFAIGARSEQWATLILIAALSAALVTLVVTDRRWSTRGLRWLIALVVLAHVIAIGEILVVDGDRRSLGSAVAAAGLLVTPALVVAGILRQRAVTLQTLYAAGAVYLMIGMGFGAVFRALARIQDGPMFVGDPLSAEHLNYFSFVTLTTLGYGDVTPVTPEGRALVVIETLIGQLFLATLVARLVSGLRIHDGRAH